MESGCLIYKYAVPTNETGMVEIEMPYAWEILCAGVQDDQVVIWVEHFQESGVQVSMGRRKIYRAFTGQLIPLDAFEPGRKVFIGTVQHPNGLVWHLYDAGWKK